MCERGSTAQCAAACLLRPDGRSCAALAAKRTAMPWRVPMMTLSDSVHA
jgi:hypothetical protein